MATVASAPVLGKTPRRPRGLEYLLTILALIEREERLATDNHDQQEVDRYVHRAERGW